MSEDWNTKYGTRRVRRDPPTLEEAIFAAVGITDDQQQQAEIAAALMSWHGPSAPRVEGIATKSRVVASCASKPASTASRSFCRVSAFIRQLQLRIPGFGE